MPDLLPPEPLDRMEAATMALDTLATLVGQSDDLECAGRDGLSAMLDLITREVEQATAALRERR